MKCGKEKYMLVMLNVAYPYRRCKQNNILFNKLLMFQIHVLLPFFPDIPAITITNQKNGCLQFISVKLSARSASTAALCAFSHRITFFTIQYTRNVVGISPYENQTSKSWNESH